LSLKDKIEAAQFHPKILGIFVNPFYIARRGLAKNIKDLGTEIKGRTLDVGCGTKPYQKFFDSSEYIGLEYDTGIDSEKKQADFYYDGKTFPFDEKEFDSAVTNQVLEHIFTPKEFLKEINRILKPEGKLLLTVPFVWDEHEQPFDYARYSSFGLKSLLEESGFEIISHKKSVNNISVLFQMLNGYIYKQAYKKPKLIKQIITLLLMSPVNLIGITAGKIFPKNNDLYLDNIVLAKKVSDV
jgi:SAM-dependent methyltransferase